MPTWYPRVGDHADRGNRAWNLDGPRVCWLSGTQGSGASAVAQSISERFYSQGRLTASFFFSRTEAERNSTKFFVPTIAHQLAISVPSLKSSILNSLRDDPSILHKAPKYQVMKLIVGPIRTMKTSFVTMSIVVDAIDDCKDRKRAVEAISLITDADTDSLLPCASLSRVYPSPRAKLLRSLSC